MPAVAWHNGAAARPFGAEPALNERYKEFVEERERVGAFAAQAIKPGQVLMVDAGSTTLEAPDRSRSAEVLALNDALDRLAELDPEQQRIVELRFFAGLTVEEIAHVLGRSPRTVKREWQLAKAWLFRELHQT